MQAWQATVQNEQGNVVFNQSVTVYLEDGVTLAPIFNEDGSPKANPFIGSLEGFVQFWANPGVYKIIGANGADLTELWEVSLTDYVRFVSPYNWGAAALPGFDNAEAISEALASADVVDFFGDDNFEVASPLTIPNGKTIRYNGSGRMVVVSGGSLTNNGTEEYSGGDLIDAEMAFGGSWKARHKISATETDQHIGEGRATTAIRKISRGSGINGPASSDYAMLIDVEKENYLTSTELGEIDGMHIAVRQGVAGDVGGVLVNAHQVQNSGYGMTTFESASSQVDSSGTKLAEFKTVLGGFLPGTDLRSGGFGFMTRPQSGFSYSHGIAILGQDTLPGTGIETAIEASSTLSPADTYFQVTGDLHPAGAGRMRISGGAATTPAISRVGDTDTGIWWPSDGVVAITTNGTNRLLVDAGVRVGSGMADPGNGNLAIAGTVSTIPTIVGALPAAGTAGRRAMVTNASNTTFREGVVGGGTNTVPVYDDGTVWRIG